MSLNVRRILLDQSAVFLDGGFVSLQTDERRQIELPNFRLPRLGLQGRFEQRQGLLIAVLFEPLLPNHEVREKQILFEFKSLQKCLFRAIPLVLQMTGQAEVAVELRHFGCVRDELTVEPLCGGVVLALHRSARLRRELLRRLSKRHDACQGHGSRQASELPDHSREN